MKIIYFLLSITVLTLTSCEEVEVEKGVPECIVEIITNFRKQTCDKGANVKEFYFQDKTVYVFDEGDCRSDRLFDVYDADCNKLGALGGISGENKINGVSFATAVYIRTVWTE